MSLFALHHSKGGPAPCTYTAGVCVSSQARDTFFPDLIRLFIINDKMYLNHLVQFNNFSMLSVFDSLRIIIKHPGSRKKTLVLNTSSQTVL